MSSHKFTVILVKYSLSELVQRIFNCGDTQHNNHTPAKNLTF